MSILISLLIFVVIISIAIWLIGFLPLPGPGQMIARAIVGVIGLVWLLNYLPGGTRLGF